MMKVLLAMLGLCAVVLATKKTLEGYQILEVVPRTKFQVQKLRDLMLSNNKLDFWLEPRAVRQPVQIMVAPQDLMVTHMTLRSLRLKVKVVRQNVQEQLDRDWARLHGKEPRAWETDEYANLADIYAQLESWAANCPAGLVCSTKNIGLSVEGREMKMFKLTKSGSAGTQAIWLDSLIHAREWLAGQTNMRLLHNLLTKYNSDPEVKALVDKYDWYFLPVFNPDGYDFTWSDPLNRFWRKNRRQDPECRGVDLNRNHAYKWDYADGISDDPCSDVYRGPSAASEPEVVNVQNEGTLLKSSLKAWITIHTAAQMWLMPLGTTDRDTGLCEISPAHDTQMRVADATADATENTHGTTWTRGNSCETIYATSGSTQDWAYGANGVVYSYTPELRGPGFDPGPEHIQPSYEEVWNGVKALIAQMEVETAPAK